MAAVTALLPYISAAGSVMAVDGYIKGEEARSEAKSAAERGAQAQTKAQNEQKASNAQQQAIERRRQYREERVRRSRVLQSSVNTGVAGGSGELGSLGSLATQLSENVGTNVGAKASGERMSGYAQDQANASFDFQQANADMSSASAEMSIGTSIFSAGGGFQGVADTPNPFKKT